MKLNNIEVPKPKIFDVDYQKISITGRTASGRFVEDIIAIKRHFRLGYKGIRYSDLAIFKSIYNSGLPAIFSYIDGEEEKTAYISIRSMPGGIYTEMPTISRDVVITLEEV